MAATIRQDTAPEKVVDNYSPRQNYDMLSEPFVDLTWLLCGEKTHSRVPYLTTLP